MSLRRRHRRSIRSALRRRYVRGALNAAGALALAAGCLVEIPPIDTVGVGGGLANDAGPGGAGNNAGGSGEVGGGGSPALCPPGTKPCGGECVEQSVDNGCGRDSCAPCPVPPGTAVACSESGACEIVACGAGYADCDGDALGADAAAVSNGCEYSFVDQLAEQPAPTRALIAARASITLDGRQDDWRGIPAVLMSEVCAGCSPDGTTPPITAEGLRPARSDLDAYFKVGWDDGFLYLMSESFDDSPVRADGDLVSAVERCDATAECEDGLVFFFDGLNDRGNGYGNDNHRFLLGLSGGVHAPTEGAPAPGDVAIAVKQFGRCTRVEAALSWQRLVGSDGAARGQLPPVEGLLFGFDVGFNDWDRVGAELGRIERQSQVYWVSPGANYHFSTEGLGELQLGPAVP